MTLKRISNEETWKEDRQWTCPYCSHKNILNSWMDEESCEKCQKTQKFESDYVDAYEGIFSTVYVGPR